MNDIKACVKSAATRKTHSLISNEKPANGDHDRNASTAVSGGSQQTAQKADPRADTRTRTNMSFSEATKSGQIRSSEADRLDDQTHGPVSHAESTQSMHEWCPESEVTPTTITKNRTPLYPSVQSRAECPKPSRKDATLEDRQNNQSLWDAADDDDDDDDDDDNAIWTLVAGKKPEPRKAVIYVGNLKKGLKEEEIRDFIEKRCARLGLRPPTVFNCKVFNKEEGAEDGEIVEFNCARLTIDRSSKKSICHRLFWPGRLYARKWKFPKNTNNDGAK